MEPEEGKISVWVCREEKLVSGLTKRTTCADVVKVLLEDQNLRQGASAAMLSGSPQSYCVVEKWRGFERILPNKTKILRLWSAWGDEQENVRFVLVKNEASLPNNGPRSAEARVVQSRDSGGPGGVLKGTAKTCWTAAAAAANLSQEKQRRIVRKAFRKLDKMNKKKEQAVSKDKSSVEKMETLVHLVISQDHTIRQQIQRIKELDREIERYEAKVHFDRIKRHGVNYVQDTYMVDSSDASAPSDCKRKAERQDARCTAEALAQFEEYARRCEEVVRLQEELTEREALVESITGEIQEELNRRWMKRRREERGAEAAKDADSVTEEVCLAASAAPEVEPDVESLSDNELVLEEERIKTQLDTSLYIGLRLKTDLDAIRGDLDLSLALWETKESELLDLLAKVETMEIEQENNKLTDDGKGELGAVSAETEPASASAEKSSVWVEKARGLSKACSTNDEDSDTGLSSMHSQDSDNPPVCESLV
ncbi:ras association domain-containing protein 10 [Thunnus albacares]|uniref:ras association domain-containing protein 10 n=1 Tax=Thunnus maccoyii TaxID=8240 RepID=UPI001C4B32F5|nr:ras association domain-containing protein 10 [Thunnus maccoyii]XP_044213483.1 ras association domain-containing protein 10 [Thunnus albacares]